MQTNQVIALLLSFVFVLMFAMIFVAMRLVNVFAHKISDAKATLRADRALGGDGDGDGDGGAATVAAPATTAV